MILTCTFVYESQVIDKSNASALDDSSKQIRSFEQGSIIDILSIGVDPINAGPSLDQGSFCVCTQPTRDDVTM